MLFFGIFIISFIVPFLFKLKYGGRVTILEWLSCTAISIALSFVVYTLGSYNALQDTELLNGYVTAKNVVEKKCKYPGWYEYSDSFCTNEHTREVVDHYEDDYCTDKDGKSYVCGEHPVYRTEYRYDYPWERKYFVHATVSEYTIARIDKQGAKEPPRFTSVAVNDPVSVTHSYENLLLGADASILNPAFIGVNEPDLAKVPAYPINVYDYYLVDRLVTIGVNVTPQERKAWNDGISQVAKSVGHRKQANPVVVLTNEPADFRYAIERKWLGGKKNDVILLVGLKDNTIEWTDVITFIHGTNNEVMSEQLTRLVNEAGYDREKILGIMQQTILDKFDRLPMQSIEYIKDSFEPPLWVSIASLICSLILSIIASLIATHNAIQENNNESPNHRYRTSNHLYRRPSGNNRSRRLW